MVQFAGGTRPVPDPTQLTNELVTKATSSLRDIIETRVTGLEGHIRSIETTLNRHVDIAISDIEKRFAIQINAEVEKAQNGRDAVKELLTTKIAALSDTVAANRQLVHDRFDLNDKATIKAAADVKSAVDAAFAAAATGVATQNQANYLASQKQEAAFTKALDTLALNVAGSAKSLDDKLNDIKRNSDDKVNDLKDRIVAMESRTSISDPTTANALRDMANAITLLRTHADSGAGREKGLGQAGAIIVGIAIVAGVAAAILVDIITRFAGVHP